MIDLPHWIDGQGIIASAFMLPALWRMWGKGAGMFKVIVAAWAIHALGGIEFFSERLAAMPKPHITATEIGPILMLLAKTTIVWAGERGRGWIWASFFATSCVWAFVAWWW